MLFFFTLHIVLGSWKTSYLKPQVTLHWKWWAWLLGCQISPWSPLLWTILLLNLFRATVSSHLSPFPDTLPSLSQRSIDGPGHIPPAAKKCLGGYRNCCQLLPKKNLIKTDKYVLVAKRTECPRLMGSFPTWILSPFKYTLDPLVGAFFSNVNHSLTFIITYTEEGTKKFTRNSRADVITTWSKNPLSQNVNHRLFLLTYFSLKKGFCHFRSFRTFISIGGLCLTTGVFLFRRQWSWFINLVS